MVNESEADPGIPGITSAQPPVPAAIPQGGQPMLANLLANLHAVAYRCRNDENWTMEFVSEGCRDLTGYAAEDLLVNSRISYENIIHPDVRARVRAEVEAALQAGPRFELTCRIVTAASDVRWVLEHGLAIPPGDGSQCFLEGIITDITGRKNTEQARRLVPGHRVLDSASRGRYTGR